MKTLVSRKELVNQKLAKLCDQASGEPMTSREIARQIGVSEQFVNQVLYKAIRKLRRRLSREPDLRHFFRP